MTTRQSNKNEQIIKAYMEKKVHANFIKSSDLIFITFGLGLINILLTRNELVTGTHKAIAISTMLFILGLGYLVRQGFDWVKYLLLVLTILGLLSSCDNNEPGTETNCRTHKCYPNYFTSLGNGYSIQNTKATGLESTETKTE